MAIIAVILVCTVAAYWLLQPKKAKSKRLRVNPGNIHRPGKLHKLYQAASINYGGCACAAVKAMGEQRFLAAEAPQLPLGTCDSAKCQCRYVRHVDRRAKEDRRAIYCLQTDLHAVAGKEEHRSKSCRRRSDQSSNAASDLQYKDIKWAT